MPPSEPKTLDDVLDDVEASSGTDGEDTAFSPANASEDSEDDNDHDDDTEVVNTDDDEDGDANEEAASVKIEHGSVIQIDLMSGATVEGHVYRPAKRDIKEWNDIGFALVVDPQRGPMHKTTVAFTKFGNDFHQIDPTDELRLMREHWLTDNKRFTMKVMLKRIAELRSNPMLTGKVHMPIISKYLKSPSHKGPRPHVIIVLSTIAFEVAKSTLEEQEKRREKKKPVGKQEASSTAKKEAVPEVKPEASSTPKKEVMPAVKEEAASAVTINSVVDADEALSLTPKRGGDTLDEPVAKRSKRSIEVTIRYSDFALAAKELAIFESALNA